MMDMKPSVIAVDPEIMSGAHQLLAEARVVPV
jgi:hypothetical protein